MDLKNGRICALVKRSSYFYSPEFSPAGDALIFLEWDGALRKYSIWKYDCNSGEEQKILTTGGTLYTQWSSDGSMFSILNTEEKNQEK